MVENPLRDNLIISYFFAYLTEYIYIGTLIIGLNERKYYFD